MPSSSLSVVVQQLRAAAGRDGSGRTDAELLSQFLSRRDEGALAALVERHAPMVWGVCRRTLRHPHDAEDAFQATFLVLVEKAATVVPREMVANWLYGVAQQTAVRLRATAAKRGWREVQMDAMPEPAVAEARDEELLLRLDEELSRLPERFRALIVLCDLEGRTRKEVARQLGCPEGTVASGLARARELLAKRLTRRGLAVSGGLVAATLSHSMALADVPATVVTSAINVATLVAAGKEAGMISGPVVALTKGVLKTMFLKKIVAPAMAVLALGVAVIAGGRLAVGQSEGKPTVGKGLKASVAENSAGAKQERAKKEAEVAWGKEAKPQAAEKAENDVPKTQTDNEAIQGTWHVVALENGGKKMPVDAIQLFKLRVVIKGNKMFETTMTPDGRDVPEREWTFVLDEKASPKSIDATRGEDKQIGIYGFEDGKLKICMDQTGKNRPTTFETEKGTAQRCLILQKEEMFTAWGKEVDGVQIGIRLGENRVYQVGETVTLVLRLRNNGKERVPFRDDAEYFYKNPPHITDADDKAITIQARSIFGFIRGRSAAPGKEVDLIQLELVLRPATDREKNAAWTLYGTGKFQIQYQVEEVVGEVRLGSPGMTLSTGKLELEVTDKPLEGERKPKDAPVNLKPEAKKVFSPDELMRQKYDPMATRTVEFKVVALAKPTEIKQSTAKDSPWVIGHGPDDVSLLPQPPKRFEEQQFSVILTSQVVGQLKRIGIKDVGKHFEGKTVRVSGRIHQHNYSGDDPPVVPHYDLVIEDVSQIEAVE